MAIAVHDVNQVNSQRRVAARDAAYNSCYLLRGLVFAATSHAPKQQKAAHLYLNRTPLHNCTAYAHKLIP